MIGIGGRRKATEELLPLADRRARARRGRRIIAATAIAASASTSAMVTPAYAFLTSGDAWTELVQYALSFVSTPGEFEVTIREVSNPLSGSITVKGLTIADADGPWFTLEEGALSWSPLQLLTGTVEINDLTLTGLKVERAPVTPDEVEEEEAPENPLEFPTVPDAIVIEKFAVVDAELGEPLMGHAVHFDATGFVKPVDDRQTVAFRMERDDGIDSVIDLTFSSAPVDDVPQVTIALDAREAQAGLLNHLMGLEVETPLALVVKADGPPDAWGGTLDLDAGEYLQGGVTFRAAWADAVTADVDGSFRPGPLMPEKGRNAFGPETDVRARVRTDDNGDVVIEEARLEAPSARADLRGRIGADDTLDVAFALKTSDAAALNALIAPNQIDAVDVSLIAKGAMAWPHLVGSASLEGLQTSDFSMRAASFRFDVAPDAPFDSPDVNIALSLDADIADPHVSAADLESFIGDKGVFAIKGVISPGASRANLERFVVDGAAFHTSGRADVDWTPDAPRLDGAFEVSADKLEALQGLIGKPIAGAITANIDARQPTASDPLVAKIQASAARLSLGDPALDPIVGASPRLALEGTITPDFDVDLSLLDVAAAGAAFQGRAKVRRDLSEVAVDGRFDAPDLSAFAEIAGMALSGALGGDIRANRARPEDDMLFDVALTGRDVAIGDPALQPLVGPTPQAVAKGRMTPDGTIRLETLTAAAAAGRFDGQALAGPGFGQIAADGRLDVPDLAPFSGLAGMDLAGAIGGEVKASRADADADLVADLNLGGRDVALGDPAVQPLVGPAPQIVAKGRMQADGTLILDSGNIALASLSFDGTALAGPDFGRIAADGALDIPDLSRFADLAGTPMSGAIGGTIKARRADADSELIADLDIDGRVVSIGDETIAPLIGQTPRVAAKARLKPDGALTLETLNAAVDAGRFDGTATVATGSGAFDADGQFDLGDLSMFAPLANTPLSGGLGGAITASRADKWSDLSTRFDIAGRGVSLGDAALDPLIGATPAARGAAVMSFEQDVTLNGVALDLAALDLTVDGTVTEAFSQLALKTRVQADDLSRFSDLAGTPLRGSAAWDGAVAGATADPGVDGTATLRKLRFGDLDLGAITAKVDAATVVSRPNGALDLTVDGAVARGALKTAFDVEPGVAAKLSGLDVKVNGAALAGDVAAPLNGDPARGALTVSVPDLNAFSKLAGADMRGAVKGEVTLLSADGQQAAKARLRLDDLAYDPGGADVAFRQVTLAADARGLNGTPRIDAALDAVDGRAGGQQIASVEARATGGAMTPRFSLKVAAGEGGADTLALSGDADATGPLKVTFDSFDATVKARRVVLARPMTIQQQGDAFDIAPIDVSVEGGRIAGSARYAPAGISTALDLTGISLALAKEFTGVDVAGALSGRIEADTGLKRRGATVRLDVVGVSTPDFAKARINPVDIGVDATWDGQQLALETTVTKLPRNSEPLRLTARAPLTGSPIPSVPNDGPIEMRLRWSGEVEPLVALAPVPDHVLTGRMSVDLAVGGTIANPTVSGGAKLADARYENLAAGTIIAPLNLDLASPDGRKLTLNLDGRDGADGTVSARGDFDLGPLIDGSGQPAIKLDFKAAAATLVRLDYASVNLDADIAVALGADSGSVTGDVRTRTAVISLPDNLPPEVADLNVIEINKPCKDPNGCASPEEKAQAEAAAAGPPINLDLVVDMPNRIYVRGRGLDSEWAGRLNVKGTASQPRVTGKIAPKRGGFDLINVFFEFERGDIVFDGGRTIDPRIDVSLSHDEGDVTGYIEAKGRASDIKLSLRSIPSLPEDEVLARVLFGKSVAELSPFEAARLAAAAATLAGVGGGSGGIQGFAQQNLGIDTLSVDAGDIGGDGDGDGGGPSITAGKYVTDNVFVGVTQGTDAGSSAVEVEIDITDQLKLETRLGQTGASRGAVEWKYDY